MDMVRSGVSGSMVVSVSYKEIKKDIWYMKSKEAGV